MNDDDLIPKERTRVGGGGGGGGWGERESGVE